MRRTLLQRVLSAVALVDLVDETRPLNQTPNHPVIRAPQDAIVLWGEELPEKPDTSWARRWWDGFRASTWWRQHTTIAGV